MSDVPSPKRPWWVPLLGVGSLGLGGLQFFGAMGLAYLAAEMGGAPATVFAWLAAGWLVPGVLLAVAGVGISAGTRWARGLGVAAAAAMIVSVALVIANRAAIPEAVASFIEWGERSGGMAADVLKWYRNREGQDPVDVLRDPVMGAISAWTFAVEFGLGAPWYLVVLWTCALKPGRSIPTPTPPAPSRTAAP